MSSLLVVEDEPLLRRVLTKRLRNEGHIVDEAATIDDARASLRRLRPEVVLLDIHLPDGNGLELLAEEQEVLAESRVIVMTAAGTIEDAVRAMKLGAWEFLSKPVDQDELLRLVQRAGEIRRREIEAEGSRRLRDRKMKRNIVAESSAMKRAIALAEKVAASSSTTVLIQGETGAGKEVVARFIHARSPRAQGPFQALNCAAMPDNLVESELFGHEKGAFTDARESRKGLFELAHGGTVVLDEIGELPLSLQAKLLRFLEERFLRRVGGSREIFVDVRVLALTNRDLEQRVAEGTFRSDLFFRLNVFPIRVPALNERPEDVLPLAYEFMERTAMNSGRAFLRIAPPFESWLQAHAWRGNVRELKNVIERAVILETGSELTGAGLIDVRPLDSRQEDDRAEEVIPLDEAEHLMVVRALKATKGNQSQAAKLLRVSRDQLRYRVKRYREDGRLPGELIAILGDGTL